MATKKLIRRFTTNNIYFDLKGEINPIYKSKWPPDFLKIFNEALEIKNMWLKMKINIAISKNLNIIHMYEKIFKNFTFGSSQNKKTFFRIINIIITRAKNECIFLSCLSTRFNLEVIPWLKGLLNKKLVIQDCIRKLLNEIVIPLFHSLYQPLVFGKQHQIRYYPRQLVTQFVVKSFNNLKNLKHLIGVETWDSKYQKCRGQLLIRSKKGLDPTNIRPILSLDQNNFFRRYLSIPTRKIINGDLFAYARTLGCAKVDCFYTNWKHYVAHIQNKKLYAAKLDLTDCFGSIDVDKLKNIIKDIPASKLREDHNEVIIELLNNNYVHVGPPKGRKGPKYFEWKRGLLQGDYFSGALCEVYLAYHENLLMQEFNVPGCFLYKKVDDYLFCSTEEEHIPRFIEAMKSFMIINDGKSEIILEGTKTCVGYCGSIINLETKEIRIKMSFEKNTMFHNRFKLWNAKQQLDRKGLIAKTLYFPYNNYYFQKMFLNLDYNSMKVLYKNFFFAMVYIAFKLETTAMSISLRKMNEDYVTVLMKTVETCVTYYSRRVASRLKTDNFKELNRNLLNIGYNAFVVVFKKRSVVYANVIKKIIKKKRHFFCTIDMKPYTRIPKQFDNICLKRKFNQSNL